MTDDLANGPYQHCRPLTDEEYAALKADIEAHGVMEYVHVDENGAILVGHHRARVAGELGIEYPRHVVHGLTEQEKHEYAVRLESLGRSKDDDTKRWTVLDLWRSGLGFSQQRIADVTGIPKSTVSDWIRAEQARLKAAREKNPAPDSSPAAPARVVDARGRSMPTAYKAREPKPAAGPESPAPVVGDVLPDIRAQFDEEGLAAEQAAARHAETMAKVRVTWLRFVTDNPPGVFADGLARAELDGLIRDLDRFLSWLERARDCAIAARRPQRVV